jgi:hypothetical protein
MSPEAVESVEIPWDVEMLGSSCFSSISFESNSQPQ